MSVPVRPDRDQARSWAVEELSHREYQAAKPSLLHRVVHWISDKINQIHFGHGAPPVLGLSLLVVVVAVVVTYALYRTGGLHRTARRAAMPVLPGQASSAADHRAAADRYAAAREWGPAVVERFRAIARELEERALLVPQPGRTAMELARDGGAALPRLADELRQAARYFDDVSYGQLAVGPAADQALRDLDSQLATAGSEAVTA